MIKRINGREFLLAINETIIALSTTCSLAISTELREVAPQGDGRARDFLPDRYTWKVSVEGLVAADGQHQRLATALLAGEQLRAVIGAGDVEDEGILELGYVGYVYCESYQETGAVGSLCGFSASFVGDGPLLPINRR